MAVTFEKGLDESDGTNYLASMSDLGGWPTWHRLS